MELQRAERRADEEHGQGRMEAALLKASSKIVSSGETLYNESAFGGSTRPDSIYGKPAFLNDWIRHANAIDNLASSANGESDLSSTFSGTENERASSMTDDTRSAGKPIDTVPNLPEGDTAGADAEGLDSDDEFEVEAAQYAILFGKTAFEKQNYQEASESLQEALKMVLELPRSRQAMYDACDIRYMLGVSYFHLHDPLGAREALLAVVEDTPRARHQDDKRRQQVLNAGHLLAQTYARLGELERARSSCNSALTGRGRLLSKTHESYYESLALLSRIVDLQGNSPRAKILAAMIPADRQKSLLDSFLHLDSTGETLGSIGPAPTKSPNLSLVTGGAAGDKSRQRSENVAEATWPPSAMSDTFLDNIPVNINCGFDATTDEPPVSANERSKSAVEISKLRNNESSLRQRLEQFSASPVEPALYGSIFLREPLEPGAATCECLEQDCQPERALQSDILADGEELAPMETPDLDLDYVLWSPNLETFEEQDSINQDSWLPSGPVHDFSNVALEYLALLTSYRTPPPADVVRRRYLLEHLARGEADLEYLEKCKFGDDTRLGLVQALLLKTNRTLRATRYARKQAKSGVVKSALSSIGVSWIFESPLHLASLYGDVEVVKTLLYAKAKVNSNVKPGLTALHCAAMTGQYEVAKVLIQAGSQVDTYTENYRDALSLAIIMEYYDIIDLLLRSGAPQRPQHSLLLCARGNLPLLKALCTEKSLRATVEGFKASWYCNTRCFINGVTPAADAVLTYLHGSGYSYSCRWTSFTDATPLIAAAYMNRLSIVKYLLAIGFDPDVGSKVRMVETTGHHVSPENWTIAKVYSVLEIACAVRCDAVVETLLTAGATPRNDPGDYLDSWFNNWDELWVAVSRNSSKCVTALLNYGLELRVSLVIHVIQNGLEEIMSSFINSEPSISIDMAGFAFCWAVYRQGGKDPPAKTIRCLQKLLQGVIGLANYIWKPQPRHAWRLPRRYSTSLRLRQ